MKKVALALVVPIISSACMTAYVEPEHDNVARINFVNEGVGSMAIHFYNDASECTDRLTAPGVKTNEAKTYRISAGRDLAFTVSKDPQGTRALFSSGVALGGAIGGVMVESALNSGCIPTIEFVAEKGRDYVFRMFSGAEECRYQFFQMPQISAPSQRATDVTFRKRQWIRPLGEAGPFCEK